MHPSGKAPRELRDTGVTLTAYPQVVESNADGRAIPALDDLATERESPGWSGMGS